MYGNSLYMVLVLGCVLISIAFRKLTGYGHVHQSMDIPKPTTLCTMHLACVCGWVVVLKYCHLCMMAISSKCESLGT